MIITPLLEKYMDVDAHVVSMRRSAFYAYSNAELYGDYTMAMYCQLCMLSARDNLLDIYAAMSPEERSASIDWILL
jgi:hypothetical protein